MSRPSIIISDAGPLIALAKTGQLNVLQALFASVLIPEAVAEELYLESDMSGSVQLAEARELGFIRIESVAKLLKFKSLSVDPGEAAAISLARERKLPLLIDDAYGRKAARDKGVSFFGTGALLLKAKEAGVISTIRPGLDALCQCGYRIAPALYNRLLELASE